MGTEEGGKGREGRIGRKRVGGEWKQKSRRGVQRHSRRRKMRHKNPRGEGAKFKFGQLILKKIIKIVAARRHILRLKCTKFYFGWGSAPDPATESHTAPPDHLAGYKGSYF